MKRRVTVKSSVYIVLIVAFLLCIAIIKLLYVAIAKEDGGLKLKEFASSRDTKTKTLYASRGTIYDQNGEELALSVNSYTLIAYLSSSRTNDINNPQHVVDKKMTAEKLAPILNMEESKILEYLSKDAYQVEFGSKGKNLTEVVKKKIEALELPGIGFIESTQRYYKMGNFASYIVGYAKTNDDGDIVGELGVESYFNDSLSGTDGFITYQSDAYGYQLPNVPTVSQEAKSGNDIYLTLDSNIQLIAENAIKTIEDTYSYDFALLAVMDAKTGAIVASATSPSFNPNDLNTLESYLNPLVSYTYEPGSTMKTFSWAAAMENGIYDGNATFRSGSIDVTDVKISDFNKVGWGTITYDKGYQFSSNVAASKLALELGRKKLNKYYKLCGFGQKTGIELSAEEKGDIDFTYPSEVASAAFGQGITVTPIQIMQATTAITNEGVMIKPYIVDKIVDQSGTVVFEGKREEVERTMSKETAAKMNELMYLANYEGLGKMWQPSSVTLQAKTGTAQIASPQGGYLKDKNIYSLLGIFPNDNPRYIVYTAVSKISSQRVVADMITKAVDEIASYANIVESKEDVTSSKSMITINNYISKKTENVKDELIANNLIPIIIGNGNYVINQYPLNSTNLVYNSKVFLVTNNQDVIIPDMYNWSLSEVKNYCKLANISLNYSGYGYVKSQNISSGTTYKNGETLIVSLDKKK